MAALYSCVGFGGGSSYIALMVLFSVPYEMIPPVALICNIIVVAGNTIYFWRGGHFDLKFLFPLIVLSIPCSYLGGLILVPKSLFQLILATVLFIIGIRMAVFEKREFYCNDEKKHFPWMISAIVGGVLGLLAGITGIGGGIFLAPLLYTLKWGTPKKIAATASAFILINSFFGLAGQMQKSLVLDRVLHFYPFYLAVFAGGQLGSWRCNFHIPENRIRKLTAILVLLVSGKLILDKLFFHS